MKKFVLCCLATCALLGLVALPALPALAADDVIYAGADLWTTTIDGATFTSFAQDPIPADFLCSGSEPFTGRIAFRGKPIMTTPRGVLGTTDTIVERLDDAPFDSDGVAVTRVRVRALSLESTEPVVVRCGKFHVTVGLDGEQPVTKMQILRTHEQGGLYAAPLELEVRLVFTPVEPRGKASSVELRQRVTFPPAAGASWTQRDPVISPGLHGFVRVDTDNDDVADTFVPGVSNFKPSLGKRDDTNGIAICDGVCPDGTFTECHCTTTYTHCVC